MRNHYTDTMNAITTKPNDNKLHKDEKVEFSNYWNDENHLIVSESNTMMRFWSRNYTVSLVNNVNNNNIVIQYPLPETRICFGIMTCPDKNIFIYVHCNYYNNDKPSIIIEIYYIDETVNKLREFIIPSNHSCGMTEGILQRIDADSFNVIWSDLVNSDELSLVSFNLNDYTPTKIISINDIEDDFEDIKQYYFITENCILKSDIIAHNNNKLDIAIVNIKRDNQSICFIEDIVIPYTHQFDKHKEIESSIIESLIDSSLCLIRVKLEDKIDALHIEIYAVDILMDIEKQSVISISPKIKYDTDVKSSIYFKEGKPYIWTDKQ